MSGNQALCRDQWEEADDSSPGKRDILGSGGLDGGSVACYRRSWDNRFAYERRTADLLLV